jgi:hypothetical protein
MAQSDQYKPSVLQVAWVFEKILEATKDGADFDELVRHYMGFNANHYITLRVAGGWAITQAFQDLRDATQGDLPLLP